MLHYRLNPPVKIVVLCVVFLCQSISGDQKEKSLYEKLLKDYNVLVRPVAETAEPVDVKLGITLQQIIDIDEQKQTIQINAWLQFEWFDYQLRWDPKQHGDISDVRLPAEKVWKPDVLLYNSVDVNFGSTYPANMIVYESGSVVWIPPGILKATCYMNIRFFPFDSQTCTFKFGSWTYDGTKLNLTNGDFDISEYTENGEWILSNATVTRNVKFYSCCKEPYIDLQFVLNLKRRTLYYAFNLIVPSLLISFMSLLGFVLPVESNQKITLEIAVLLSLCIFTSIVAQATPPTSESLPMIGIFYICNMLAVAASVISNVVVINLYHRRSKSIPKVVRKIFLEFLPPYLLMKRRATSDASMKSRYLIDNAVDRFDEQNVCFSDPSLTTAADKQPYASSSMGGIDNRFHRYQSGGGRSASANHYSEYRQSPSEPVLMKILDVLRQFGRRYDENDETSKTLREWKYVSAVLDRLCLVFFGFVFFVTTCATIFRRA